MLRSSDFRAYFQKKGSLIYICLYNMAARCPKGSYFLDDLQQMANRHNRTANHILEEELKPKPIRETDTFVALQLEFLHLQLVSILSGTALK